MGGKERGVQIHWYVNRRKIVTSLN